MMIRTEDWADECICIAARVLNHIMNITLTCTQNEVLNVSRAWVKGKL